MKRPVLILSLMFLLATLSGGASKSQASRSGRLQSVVPGKCRKRSGERSDAGERVSRQVSAGSVRAVFEGLDRAGARHSF